MTTHVSLREVIDSDLPILYEQQADPVANDMAAFPARDRDAFMAHWEKIRSNTSVTNRTIVFNGQVAGNIACYESSGAWEIGYWIGREYWGQGIATQALTGLLGLVKTRPLFAHVTQHNVASRRVLEKCGFKVIGEDKWRPRPDVEEVEEFILRLDAIDQA